MLQTSPEARMLRHSNTCMNKTHKLAANAGQHATETFHEHYPLATLHDKLGDLDWARLLALQCWPVF